MSQFFSMVKIMQLFITKKQLLYKSNKQIINLTKKEFKKDRKLTDKNYFRE